MSQRAHVIPRMNMCVTSPEKSDITETEKPGFVVCCSSQGCVTVGCVTLVVMHSFLCSPLASVPFLQLQNMSVKVLVL